MLNVLIEMASADYWQVFNRALLGFFGAPTFLSAFRG